MKFVIFYMALISIFLTVEAMACRECIKLDKNEPFIASSSVPFTKLMEDSMHLMEDRMSKADLKAKNEKIFLEMMIAHHQGALDMANSILVHSKDATLQNYARSIISSQYNEILYMQTLLKKYDRK